MASPVLKKCEVNTFKASLLTDSTTIPVPAPSLREAPAFFDTEEFQSESSAGGINCAKGYLMAIGVEAVAALCLFGIWQAWHIFR